MVLLMVSESLLNLALGYLVCFFRDSKMGCVSLCVWLMFYLQSMLNSNNAHVPGVHKLASC